MTAPAASGQKPAAGAKPSLAQVVRNVSSRGTDIVKEFDPETAAYLQRMRGVRPDKPTVVIVGEAKRGKSSLLNALINVPGLSPVDARVATSTYLVFRRGAENSARALLAGNDTPVPIPIDRMRDWATDLGNRGERQPPRLIEVECTSPLLSNLNLIDTPGVGGLDAAHGEIALRAIARATALLFVVDASAPFTKPELDFLLRASQTVDLVIFAVTKIDAYRGWRQIVEDNRALLREHAPRFAESEMIPVSSKMFEQAAAMGSSELAVALRKESNIIPLQMALQTKVAAKSAALHEANVLRTLSSQLTGVQSQLQGQIAASQPDPVRAAQLKENRERLLAAKKQDSKAWQLKLRGDMSRARVDTMADIQNEVREQLQYWRAAIDRADRSMLPRLGPELDAAIQALSMRVADRQVRRLGRVADNVLRTMFAPYEMAEVYASLRRAPSLRKRTMPPRKREASMEEKVVAITAITGGVGIGRMVTMLPIFGAATAVALPISIALGLGAAGWMIWMRRQGADRTHLKQWVAESMQETRSAFEANATSQFIDAEQALTLALDRALTRRIETVDKQIRQIDEIMKVDKRDRDARVAALTKQLTEVKQLINAIEQLLPRLRNAVVAAKKPAVAAGSQPAGTAAAPAPSVKAGPVTAAPTNAGGG